MRILARSSWPVSIAGDARADRQEIHEAADHVFHFVARAPGDDCADDHVVLPVHFWNVSVSAVNSTAKGVLFP